MKANITRFVKKVQLLVYLPIFLTILNCAPGGAGYSSYSPNNNYLSSSSSSDDESEDDEPQQVNIYPSLSDYKLSSKPQETNLFFGNQTNFSNQTNFGNSVSSGPQEMKSSSNFTYSYPRSSGSQEMKSGSKSQGLNPFFSNQTNFGNSVSSGPQEMKSSSNFTYSYPGSSGSQEMKSGSKSQGLNPFFGNQVNFYGNSRAVKSEPQNFNVVNFGSIASNPRKISSEPQEIILFCGNPGVGKSSLCNSIFQQHVFQSGISVGKGMTQQKQEYIHENKKYIDTPGLADIQLRKQAAQEIEKALKQNNNYKIIFVATLESARIKQADLVTINTVCDAIKTKFDYGIIFNKVTKPVIKDIGAKGENLKDYLSTLHKQPSSTLVIEKDNEMEDQNNVYLPASEERNKLISFIKGLQANRIEDKKVGQVNVDEYEKKISKMETQLVKINENLEKQKKDNERLQQENEKWRKLAMQKQQEIQQEIDDQEEKIREDKERNKIRAQNRRRIKEANAKKRDNMLLLSQQVSSMNMGMGMRFHMHNWVLVPYVQYGFFGSSQVLQCSICGQTQSGYGSGY